VSSFVFHGQGFDGNEPVSILSMLRIAYLPEEHWYFGQYLISQQLGLRIHDFYSDKDQTTLYWGM
jgi:hypothetical protein